MKLVRLEIEGFKSFGSHVNFEIKDGIVSIVGPNGSGKSNIVDAVRWLFGERANSKLRMSDTTDVLYFGSNSMKKADKASVKAIFYDDGKEISVEKTYQADGKSYYLLNGTVSRLKDMEEVFFGTGTGKDFYSIVGQGEISNLVNSSPMQIKALIEEAAGVLIYKERKNEALSKLKEVNENLEKLSTVMDEVDHTMKSLNLKSKRAKKYKEYENIIAEKKRLYFGHLLSVGMKANEELKSKIDERTKKVEELQKALFSLEIETSKLKEFSANAQEDIKRFEDEMGTYRQRERTLSDLKDSISAKLSTMRSAYVELGTKKDGMKSEIERSNVRLEELRRLVSSLKSEEDKISSNLKEIGDRYNAMVEEVSKEQKKRASIESRISALTKERNSKEVERSKVFENTKDLRQRLDILNAQIREKTDNASKISENLDKFSAEESKFLASVESKSKRLQEIDVERKQLEDDVKDTKNRKDNISSKLVELKSKHEILLKNIESYAGYSNATRIVMGSGIKGIIDVVANMIDVPVDVEVAISVLLGGRMQNIVVKNSDVAKACVEFLKQNDAGRTTFIPLDMVDLKEPGIQSSVIAFKGVVGYGFKIVRAVKGYESLVNFLFGTDLIVKTLDDAIEVKRHFNFRSRIVSLDGQLISPTGTITGGSMDRSERTDLISQRRVMKDIENEIINVSKEIKKIEAHLSESQARMEEILYERKEIESALLKENISLNNSRGNKNALLSKLAELQKEVDNLEKMRNDYAARLEKNEKTISDSEERIRNIDSELSELELVKRNDSTEDIRRRQEMEKLQEQMIDLKMQLNSIRERFSGYSGETTRLSSRAEELSTEVSSIENQLKNLISEINTSEERLKNSEKELESVRKDAEKLFERSKDTRGDREELIKKMEEMDKMSTQKRDEISSVREELHAFDVERVSIESSIQNALAELQKVEGQVEDAKALDDQTFENLGKEIEDYERKLKFLGPVDLSSIEEYDETEKRFNELKVQKDDLENSYNSLQDVIKKTDDEARIRLTTTIERINENFGRMISVLFSEGTGMLSFTEGLDILDAPVEISVKIPGKKMQKLYTMSGGEKSLVGIAFIFSLLMINPSPFYILDEVDAALDDFSTQRFIDLLEEYSKKATFIVITHNKFIMERANMLYGITMIDGTSTIIPVELSDFSPAKVDE